MVQSKKQGKYINAVLCVFCICMCGSRNFHQVGGGGGGGGGVAVQAHLTVKSSDSVFCYFCCFLVFTFTYLTVLQRGPIPGSDGLFFRNNNFSRFQRASNILRGGGGVHFSPGGGVRPNANFCRNLSKLWFSPNSLSPLCIRACSAFTCSSDPVIDLHLLLCASLAGRDEVSSYIYV